MVDKVELSKKSMKSIKKCDNSNADAWLQTYMAELDAASDLGDIPDPSDTERYREVELLAYSLYHYTRAEALISIIQSGRDSEGCRRSDFTLRFTRVDYMNDYYDGSDVFNFMFQEFVQTTESEGIATGFLAYATEMVDKLHIGAYSDSKRVSYICSLTFDGDSLPMWRNYSANGGGYNIEFSTQALIDLCELDYRCVDISLIPVIYDYDTMLRVIRSFMRKVSAFWESDETSFSDFEALLDSFIVFFKLSFKHPSFSHEQEVRLVKYGRRIYDINPLENYASNNGVLRPYISIDIPKNALIGVTVGPLIEAEISKRSIEDLLTANMDWEAKFPVSISAAPIRF